MKTAPAFLMGAALLAGCSGASTIDRPDTAPYSAVVVFQWAEDQHGDPAPSPGGPEGPAGTEAAPAAGGEEAPPPPRGYSREDIEDAILYGLEDNRVFSRLVYGDWDGMVALARQEKCDLLVLVRMGKFCRWEEKKPRILTGLASVNTLLWFATGFGGWWLADREYSTESDIGVYWRRPDPQELQPSPAIDPADPKALAMAFRGRREPLSTGEYRLNQWDRAKPWRYPWPYLASILIPHAFLPMHDRDEVGRSLEGLALEDVSREIARKLGGGYLQSAGAPFLFHLDKPSNGEQVDAPSVPLSYRYAVADGFEAHEKTGVRSLSILLKPAGSKKFQTVKRYEGSEVNEKVLSGETLLDEVGGLEPGINLIRFEAVAELAPIPVTNTIAIHRK